MIFDDRLWSLEEGKKSKVIPQLGIVKIIIRRQSENPGYQMSLGGTVRNCWLCWENQERSLECN